MTITVTMPYWRVGPDVRRAVLSIVGQTFTDWRLVIVNDGDPEPPWRWIDDIVDRRIVRFDLPVNRGRYFADAVVFAACRPSWWALQDADDWSEPDRFATMMPVAEKYGCVQGPAFKWRNGQRKFVDGGVNRPASPDGIAYIGRGWLAGVVAAERIGQVGGFHPEFRVGWDQYLANAVKLTGPFGTVDVATYNRVVREGSLTRLPDSRAGSPLRRAAKKRRSRLYRQLVDVQRRNGDTAAPVRDDIDPAVAAEVETHAERLQELL